MNIQRINHNKLTNQRKAYKGLMSCIEETAMLINILKDRNAAINKGYTKANYERRKQLDENIKFNNELIFAHNKKMKKLLKEKQVLESRGV